MGIKDTKLYNDIFDTIKYKEAISIHYLQAEYHIGYKVAKALYDEWKYYNDKKLYNSLIAGIGVMLEKERTIEWITKTFDICKSFAEDIVEDYEEGIK